MKTIKRRKKNKLNEHKIIILGVIFFILLTAFVAIPTLSSYKNRNLSQSITVWDGTVAESYRSGDGTKGDPYVIANGEELAYFASQLQTTNYEGKYFKLSNNIVLNEGIFSYNKTEGIKYIKDDSENIITPNLENELINKFQHLNNFKGTFDGDYYTIFGVYIDEVLGDGQNAFFTNLEGDIKNLYIENSVIYGGNVTAGVASKSNNATLTNVLYDGFVISDEVEEIGIIEKELEDITLNSQGINLNEILYIDDLEYIPGLVTEVVLSGNYSVDNSDGLLKINDQNINVGDFQIILSDKIIREITLNYQSNSTINITGLKYQIKYSYANAAGIISIAENTTLQNVVNNANVSASVYGSGIINFIKGTTTLKNVYNTGKIDSNNVSTGLISGINQNKKDTTIINCYNDGELNSNSNSMIGNIEYNFGNVTLENVFNPQDNYVINLVEESNVLVNNSYVVTSETINLGTSSSGEFIPATKENLEDKAFIQEYLQYEEFNEEEVNLDSPWVFLDSSLPKIFIDYSKANIYIGDYKWDKYKNQLDVLNFSKKFVFSIEATDELNTIKEIYYYISNSEDTLTKDELNEVAEWAKYENIVEINSDGIYTIYAKIISANDSVIYLNTDLIILDLTGPNILMSALDKVWDSSSEEINSYYIDDIINVTIEANDSLAGIKDIYYYKTDSILTKEELESLEVWNQYTDSILVTEPKTIIYSKVVDNSGNITYVNSDLIIMNGYVLNSLYSGMHGEEVNDLAITEKSSVSLRFTYQDIAQYTTDNKHQIVSNILLPENTVITIIDKLKNKVYKYETTDDKYGYDECINDICQATYDFELFNEAGTISMFQESSYTGEINEEFIINIDFYTEV